MSTARLHALPTRRERHFGDRVLRCFARRAPNVYAGFAAAARAHAAAEALVFGERRWTYAALEAEVARLAAGLAAHGLGRGDRAVMYLRNRPEFVTLFYALQRLGAVAVPVDVRLQGPELGHVLANSGARLLLHDAEFADRIPAALALAPGVPALALPEDAPPFPEIPAGRAPPPAEPHEDEVALILYTSGTTGRPKGAALAHLNVTHSAIHHGENLGLGPADRAVIAVPLSHVTGVLCGVVAPLWAGATLILLPRFKARDLLAAAARERMTYTIMVPAMYNLILRAEEFGQHDLSAWRIGHFGGSPMPDATVEALARRLPQLTLVNGYGATETCSPAVMAPVGEGQSAGAAVGRPLPCAELLVVDPETGIERPVGEAGEIWVRGPMVAIGYWQDPEATARSFVAGFWRSGDIGRIDARGEVHLHDRLKDMINRGGYKIYSAEVEAVLARHPAVIEAATVGRPDPVLGERVHAFVSLSAMLPEDALAAFCAGHLGDYKVPESWSLSLAPLPRTATGKIAKAELRRQLAGA